MLPRVILVAALCCGCLAAPMESGRSNRGIVNSFQDMVGGWVDKLTGIASGVSHTTETGVGSIMDMFGYFLPFSSDSNVNMASVVAFNSAGKLSTTVTTVAPTTTTFKNHWIVFGKK